MTVYCFSATGRSREVAAHLASALGTEVVDIRRDMTEFQNETAVVVFPVYCQNIPEQVRRFLSRLDARNVALIACYGRMHHGNVLKEAENLLSGRVIAGAYVPIGHTYLNEPAKPDTEALKPLLERIQNPLPAKLHREFKNPLADFLPELRGRLGVRLNRNPRCDGCGICTENCPVGGIKSGIPDKNCIRCLGCVESCPKQALEVRYTWPLRLYLRKKKKDKTILYL